MRRGALSGAALVLCSLAAPSHASDLQVSVVVEPAVSPVGTLLRARVRVRDPSADSVTVTLSLGDGRVRTLGSYAYCVPGQRSSGVDRDVTYDFGYRYAGAYTVTAVVHTDGCDAAREDAAAVAVAAATPGDVRSNGPVVPQLHVATPRRDRRRVVVPVDVGDNDAGVATVEVAWGDGSRSSWRSRSCDDPVLSWPTLRAHLEARHDYRRAGTFRVRISARSLGCDGADPQSTRTSTVAVRVP